MKVSPDPITQEIWRAARYYGLVNATQISKACKIPYWIVQDRLKNPGNITVDELRTFRRTLKIDLSKVEG